MKKQKTIKLRKKYKLLYKISYIQEEKKEEDEEVCDDPEIEAWLNGGDKEQSEQEHFEEKPLDSHDLALINQYRFNHNNLLCLFTKLIISKKGGFYHLI